MTNNNFICGTLEGFYGRPWRTDQRLQLFQWMQDWDGMNAYMYAPKDDFYHRSKWRDLYPDDILSELKDLVQDCQQKDLDFIYALAPGLDITYSSESDWNSLKNKVEQIMIRPTSQYIEVHPYKPLLLNHQKECMSQSIHS